MKFLELPVRFLLSSESELSKYKDMNIEIEPEVEDGILYVYPHAISEFNEDDAGTVKLSLNNQRDYTIYLSLEEFKKVIEYGK